MTLLFNLFLLVLCYLGSITLCYLIWQIGHRLGWENNTSDWPASRKQ